MGAHAPPNNKITISVRMAWGDGNHAETLCVLRGDPPSTPGKPRRALRTQRVDGFHDTLPVTDRGHRQDGGPSPPTTKSRLFRHWHGLLSSRSTLLTPRANHKKHERMEANPLVPTSRNHEIHEDTRKKAPPRAKPDPRETRKSQDHNLGARGVG